MGKRMIENNRVTISGEIVSNFTFDHEVYGEGFYVANLSSKRISDTVDIIPIMVSERMVDVKANWKGRQIRVEGQFRSYNKHEGERNRLVLSVFVRDFEKMAFNYDENHIYIDGFVCKVPIYRTTPLGREIGDIIVAANRPYGKSDYIPCICWGRNARFASSFEIGEHISLEGRIQSREYKKRISEEEYETRIAYEVSASKIEVI